MYRTVSQRQWWFACADIQQELQNAFDWFDVDQDNAVSATDLQLAAAKLGVDLDIAEADALLAETTAADAADSDGKFRLSTLQQLMQANLRPQ